MASLDIERAGKLLKSAEDLFKEGDLAGVAGLAYQAFESATMALIKVKNGMDQKSHLGRRKRAKELLEEFRDKIDFLWEIRNVDFYGNVSFGAESRDVSEEEVKDSLKTVAEMIKKIGRFLKP